VVSFSTGQRRWFGGARTPQRGSRGRGQSPGARGFSLLDLLVSMAVLAVLISIITPSLRFFTEAARRVVCQSQLSQFGVALTLWVDEPSHFGRLPSSELAEPILRNQEPIQPSKKMQLVHLGEDDPAAWDGLGRLVQEGYLTEQALFYCPSHHGLHPQERYNPEWVMLGERIVCNYHYRLISPRGGKLRDLSPDTAILTDGMRSVQDYSHRIGNNVLKADMSVEWFADTEQYITDLLPEEESAPDAGVPVFSSWHVLDTGLPPDGAGDGEDLDGRAVLKLKVNDVHND